MPRVAVALLATIAVCGGCAGASTSTHTSGASTRTAESSPPPSSTSRTCTKSSLSSSGQEYEINIVTHAATEFQTDLNHASDSVNPRMHRDALRLLRAALVAYEDAKPWHPCNSTAQHERALEGTALVYWITSSKKVAEAPEFGGGQHSLLRSVAVSQSLGDTDLQKLGRLLQSTGT